MQRHVMKYNPAFLSASELVDRFVVRQADLAAILQSVRENTTAANQHVLVIGPRGSGKTMLVQRLAVEIQRDSELRENWYPIVFSEESYEVTTPGEFWLAALFHLGQQTDDPRWQAKYKEYGSQWRDENTMRELALSQLMAFAGEQGKKLLLIVENLNGLLGNQISNDDAWKLRHTLQNEPRVMLLATATSRFEEIDNADKAMYELFRIHDLRPLDKDDCRSLWQSLTGQSLEADRVRPIQILTGGNLRLLTILATFAAHLSLRELMGDLVALVDDHTAYFKSHLDALPTVERKVYLALAELWDPSTARDVATAARLDVNRTSSLLGRLVDRGAVAVFDERGGSKWYQVAERMYNIYYLFRHRGSPAERVRAVVRFMVVFYEPEQLVHAAQRIAEEVCTLDPDQRRDHYQAYCGLVCDISVNSVRNSLVDLARQKFVGLEDVPETLAKLIRPKKSQKETLAMLIAASPKLREAAGALREVAPSEDQFGTTAHALQEFIKALLPVYELLHGNVAQFNGVQEWSQLTSDVDKVLFEALELRGRLLCATSSRLEEAEGSYRKAIEIDPRRASVWVRLGQLLHAQPVRFPEAEEAYRKAIEIDPRYAEAWGQLGVLFHKKLDRFKEAEEAYRTALEIDPEAHRGWMLLGDLMNAKLGRCAEAEDAYREAARTDSKCPVAQNAILSLICRRPERYEEALRFAEGALSDSADDPSLLNSFAWELFKTGDQFMLAQALRWAQKAASADPDSSHVQHTLSSIQCAMGDLVGAMYSARKYFADDKVVQNTLEHATNLIVEVAARGQAKGVLQILMESPSREQLEPMTVGIRVFLGEDVTVAAEIKEIGQDVARRIQQRRDALQANL